MAMADEDKPSEHPQPSVKLPENVPSDTSPPQVDPISPSPTDRAELLQRARAFLVSPQVKNENLVAKRQFLEKKGLTDSEIESIIYEVPPPAPPLPPRTYPQPPPSRVPYLLLNVLRTFTWLAGGSAALLIAYFRFLYPKIAHSYQARISLRSHRSALLQQLTRSLEDLKATQQKTFAVLPQPDSFREPARYADCHGLEQLAAAAGDAQDVPPITLLRCAIEDCSKGEQNATSPGLFRALADKFPWITEKDTQLEETLWRTLTTTPVFRPVDPAAPSPSSSPVASPPSTSPSPAPSPETIWTYAAPSPPPPPPLLTSLASLSSALPPPPASAPAPKYQHTFQALSDLTGYITTQTYALPAGFRAPALGLGSSALSPEEEEVRREIRALKGLALNRRSFMPHVPVPRVGVPQPQPQPVGGVA